MRGRSDAKRTICVRVRACVLSVRQRSSDLRGEGSKVADQLISFFCWCF